MNSTTEESKLPANKAPKIIRAATIGDSQYLLVTFKTAQIFCLSFDMNLLIHSM